MDPRDTSGKAQDTPATFGGMPLRDPATFTATELECIKNAGNRMFLALAGTLLTWSPPNVGKVNILEHTPPDILEQPWSTLALEHGATDQPNVGPFGVPYLPAVAIAMELPRDLRPYAIKRLLWLARAIGQSPVRVWRSVQGIVDNSEL